MKLVSFISSQNFQLWHFVHNSPGIKNSLVLGIRTSSTKPPKVFSIRGKRQVGYVKSNERGTLVTAICCASAGGGFVPAVLIFPRKKMNSKFTKGLPPDAKCFLSDSGWVNADLFLKWLQFSYSHVRPTPEHKALLILDNHEAHRSIKVVEYAREHNIVILSLPPHTSHRVQPLDVSVFSSFEGRFERVVAKWQKRYVGATMNSFDIGELFGEAYFFAATQSNAIEGFKKTGIADCDINVFQDRDFRPADVTSDNDVPVDGQIDQELLAHQVEAITEEEEIPAIESNEVLA